MPAKYISPIHIYARIKEEMKDYFNAGALDDILFPIWTRDCLDKMENTYLPIEQAVMDLWDHKCELPCNFNSVREVWMCATFSKGPIISPHVFYYQTDCRVSPAPDQSSSCSECQPGYQCTTHAQQAVNLPSLCDVPPQYVVTNKVMTQLSFTFSVSCLLKPGNFKTVDRCHPGSPNISSWTVDTFDLVGNKMVTSFPQGTIYMAYYANREPDEQGYYLIPDNDPFQKYVYYYIRYMIYQQLFDQSTDESFNQIRAKMQLAEQKSDEAYIVAKTYAVSPDIYDVQKSIIRSYNRNNRFKIRSPNTR